jgi:hypothetical protein
MEFLFRRNDCYSQRPVITIEQTVIINAVRILLELGNTLKRFLLRRNGLSQVVIGRILEDQFSIFLVKRKSRTMLDNNNLLPLHPILQDVCMHFPVGITTYLLSNQFNVKPASPESHI